MVLTIMKKTELAHLSQELIQAALLASRRNNITLAEQIESWALLGRKVDKMITQDDMLDVLCGIALLRVEKA